MQVFGDLAAGLQPSVMSQSCSQGNQTKAVKLLGTSQQSLSKKMLKYYAGFLGIAPL